jgi:predicted nucleic acid-binding protein
VTRFVLDASAIITIYENRAGAEKLAALLQQAGDAKAKLAMSVVNWGEAYYSVWNTSGPGVARHVIEEIAQLPISIVPADLEQTRFAAELKAQHKLPYADCFAASLALLQRATLVAADSDFSLLKKKLSLLLLS